MTKHTDRRSTKHLPLLALLLSSSAGCLYIGDPGSITPDPEMAATMSGAQIQLIRHSTTCGASEARGVVVEVGPGLEYSSDAVAALKTNCTGTPNPGIEVHVADTAIVFDFSNIAAPGRFPDGAFEGYIIEVIPTTTAPFLVTAAVDWSVTHLDLTDGDLEYEPGRLAVNLSGRAFDADSLLKVDLFLANLAFSEESL